MMFSGERPNKHTGAGLAVMLAVSLFSHPALAQHPATADETGVIIAPVLIDPDGDDPAEDLLMTPTASPGILFPYSEDVSTATLAPGRTHFYQFRHRFITDLQASDIDVTLKLTAPVLIDAIGGDTQTVRFTVLTDIFPPVTTLAFNGMVFESEGRIYLSTATRILLSAEDPVVQGHARAGLDHISFYNDVADTTTATPDVYAGPISFMGGKHQLAWLSVDRIGNAETTDSMELLVDSEPPGATLDVSGESGEEDGEIVVTASASITLVTVDPAIIDVPGSGILETRFFIDITPEECEGVPSNPSEPQGSCANPRYAVPFTLELGSHTIHLVMKDMLGNERQQTILMVVRPNTDILPPRTDILSSGPQYMESENHLYVASTTILSLIAHDDWSRLFDNIGVGVAYTSYSLDWSAFSTDASTFTIPDEGPHLLRYFSADALGRLEVIHIATIAVDATTPAIEIIHPIDGSPLGMNSLPIAIGFRDPDIAVDFQGAGVSTASVLVSIDESTYTPTQITASSMTLNVPALADGPHTLQVEVQDRVGNKASAAAVYTMDTVPPQVTGLYPAGGELLMAGRDNFSVRFNVADNLAQPIAAQAYLARLDEAGPSHLLEVVAVSSGIPTDPETYGVGTWELIVAATDFALNPTTVVSGSFTIVPWAPPPPPDITETKQVVYVSSFAPCHPGLAVDVAVDRDGYVYVSEDGGKGISKFDANGHCLLSWGGQGSGPGQFAGVPYGINVTLDANNRVLAADTFNRRVQVFDSMGAIVSIIGPDIAGAGSLTMPSGVAGDGTYVYIADNSLNKIFKTTYDGAYQASWPIPNPYNRVWHVTIDTAGAVCAAGGGMMIKFDKVGNVLQQIVSQSCQYNDGTLCDSRGLAFDAYNNLYITDSSQECYSGRCVQVFSPSGQFITKFGSLGTGPGQFWQPGPFGISVNRSNGRIYAADTFGNRILMFDVSVPTSDIKPPITELAFLDGAGRNSSGEWIVSPTGRISFNVTDVASAGITPSGPAYTEYRLDSTTAAFRRDVPFSVGNDPYYAYQHRLEYRSVDLAGNFEALKSTTIRVDDRNPESALFVDDVQVTGLYSGDLGPVLPDYVVTTASRLKLVSYDLGGAGAGTFTVALDSVAVSVSSIGQANCSPVAFDMGMCRGVEIIIPGGLSAGWHTLVWHSTDKAGNSEVPKTISFNAQPVPANPVQNPHFKPISQFANDAFSTIGDIAIDFMGNVFVSNNYAIMKYSPDGNLLLSREIGHYGAGFGISPIYFTYTPDKSRKLLVGEINRVDIYDDELQYISSLQASFNNVYDIVVDTAGFIYVADSGQGKIFKFSPDYLTHPQSLQEWGHRGSDPNIPGEFIAGPRRLTIDGNGVIYAADITPGRVLMFSNTGGYLGALGGAFGQPEGLGVDLYNNVYVSDYAQHRVLVYSSTGALISQFGSEGSDLGKFSSPAGLDVLKNAGRVYVADSGNRRVQVFTTGQPPSDVSDLSVSLTQEGDAVLGWTAPGGDGNTGAAAEYDLRMSTMTLSSLEEFLAAPRLAEAPVPRIAGTAESLTLANLTGNTTYYFRLRALDAGAMASNLSNLAAIQTPYIVRSTSIVNAKPELVFTARQEIDAVVVSTEAGAGALMVADAISQSLVLVSGIYDLSPEQTSFSPAAVLTLRYSTITVVEQEVFENELDIYRYSASSGWVRTDGQMLDQDNDLVRLPIGQIASAFAIFGKVHDHTEPITKLRYFEGGILYDALEPLIVSTGTSFVLEASDPVHQGTFTGVAYTEYRIDPVTPDAPYLRGTTFTLTAGAHIVEFRSADNTGNLEAVKRATVHLLPAMPENPARNPYLEFVERLGQGGRTVSPYPFSGISDVDVDGQGNLYVADLANSPNPRIQVFNSTGQFIRVFNSGSDMNGIGVSRDPVNPLIAVSDLTGYLHIYNSSGVLARDIGPTMNGQNWWPFDAAFDSAGKIIVLTSGALFKLDSQGAYLSSWQPGFPAEKVAVDEAGYVYASSRDRVVKFTPDGQKVGEWGAAGSGLGQFDQLIGIAVDVRANVYTLEGGWNYGKSRIQVFSSSGGFITQYGNGLSTYAYINYYGNPALSGIGVDRNTGRIYAANSPFNSVAIYQIDNSTPDPILYGSTRLATQQPLFIAKSSPYSHVSLYDGGQLIAAGQVPESGIAQLMPASPLSIGAHRFSVDSYDDAGHRSALTPTIEARIVPENAVILSTPVAFTVYPNPLTSTATVVADFNGDGTPDIVTLGVGGYAAYLGRGDGTFTQLPTMAAAGSDDRFWRFSDALAVDLDQDGTQDIVASHGYRSSIGVFFGNGDGTFQAQQIYQAGFNYIGKIAAADFNGDGRLDLAVSQLPLDDPSHQSNFSILSGAAGGTFQPPLVSTSNYYTDGIRAADFNGDGRMDVIAGGSVFYGDGAGGLTPGPVLGADAVQPVVADLNGDGRLDVVILDSQQNVQRLLAYLGLGGGEYLSLPPVVIPVVYRIAAIAADITQDGTPDIIAGNWSKFYVFSGKGDGRFSLPFRVDVPNTLEVSNITVADVVGSGSPDLLIASNDNIVDFTLYPNGNAPVDLQAPSAITNLFAHAASTSGISLSWTAPGDDGARGRATRYDVRYDVSPIIESSFAGATPVTAPTPQLSGSDEAMSITGLNSGLHYYFAVKSIDEVDNVSAISNSAEAATLYLAQSTPLPGEEPELVFIATRPVTVEFVSTTSPRGVVALGKADEANLLRASNLYELGPDGAFSPEATLLFRYSTATLEAMGLQASDIGVYEYFESSGWVRLEAQTLDEQSKLIRVTLSSIASLFSIFAPRPDKTPPETVLNVVDGISFYSGSGDLYVSSTAAFGFTAYDPVGNANPSGFALTQYRVDPDTPTAPFVQFSTAFFLPEGRHIVEFQSVDHAGNWEVAKSSTVFVDASAPLSALDIGEPKVVVETVTIVSTATAILAVSSDQPAGLSASGLNNIYVSIGTSAFDVRTASFTLALPDGEKLIRYYGRDNVSNEELIRVATIFLDATAPQSNLVLLKGFQVPYPDTGSVVASGDSIFSFEAVDPAISSMSAGVAAVEYGIDGSSFTAGPSSFTLVSGRHEVAYRAVDRVGNVEGVHGAVIQMDTASPNISISSPAGAARYVAGVDVIEIRYRATDEFDSAPQIAAFLVEREDRGKSRGEKPVLIPVSTGQILLPVDLDDGLWELVVSATDFVRNSTIAASGPFEIVHDVMKPRTYAAVGIPRAVGSGGVPVIGRTTPINLTSFDDLTALEDNQGFGVAYQRVEVDGLFRSSFSNSAPAIEQAFSSTFTLNSVMDGQHAVAYYAEDILGNRELLRTSTVAVDATSPETTLALAGPSVGNYVSSATIITFSATDPEHNGVTSGPEWTHYRINSGAFVDGPLSFRVGDTDGVYSIDYQSQDRAGNLEVIRSTSVIIDVTPPVTTPHLSTPSYVSADGSVYITPETRLSFTAEDMISSGVASGLAWTRWQDNSGDFTDYSSTFSLSAGRHVLAYRSQDRVDNLEVLRSTTVLVDAAAPLTTASIGSPSYVSGDIRYITPATPITFTAVDPELDDQTAGSGVDRIEVAVDTADFVAYTAPLALAEGKHILRYRSIDKVGNIETAQTLELHSDATAPESISSVGDPKVDIAGSPSIVGPATLIGLSAQDSINNEVASGLRELKYRIGTDAYVLYADSFSLAQPEGLKSIEFYSADNLGNTEALKTFALTLDSKAPQTTLTMSGGRQSGAYASADTMFGFGAVDVPAGVALTQWQDGEGEWTTYSSTFTLSPGQHVLACRSQDRVGNLEMEHSTTVLIDANAPVTTANVGMPSFGKYVTPITRISFTAQDAALDIETAGSGVDRIEVSVDDGDYAAYTAPLALAEGKHTLRYRSIDKVGNIETAQTLELHSDATAPESISSVGDPKVDIAGSPTVVGPATLIGLSAQDPVSNEVASGLRELSYRVGADPFGFYAGSITLFMPDGQKAIEYYATDNLGNAESTKTLALALDATAPETSLAVLGGHQFPGPDPFTFYASPDSRFALPAYDPMVNEVASGLALTRFKDNNSPFQPFESPFGLIEGAHQLSYQSLDKVANVAVLRSTTILVDATPPAAAAHIGSPLYVAPDGTNYITPATPVTFTASDPAIAPTVPGSGVERIEVAVDGGPFTAYSTTLFFAEGRHTILYRSLDHVANVEAARTLQVQSDAAPPISSLVIGQPQFRLPNVLLVSSRTPFSIAAIDPTAGGVASGVKDAFFRVFDASSAPAAFQAFTAPFAISGLDVEKTIEFYSRDNALNVEAVKSSAVMLDSTPPELALLSPSACDFGICRVLEGEFPVLGSAADIHLRSYKLEYAPGRDAGSGFVCIGSGTVSMSSGTLALWDASALAGWQTLRLTAADLVENVSTLSLNVYIGDPAALMALGDHDVFNMPEGVAVGRDGRIYVADRNNDRIAVFSSTGTLLASFGDEKRGKHENHGEPSASTTTLRLSKPSGVAVDAAGDIYVADTLNDRVLKLSAEGRVLLDIGRYEQEQGEPHGGLHRHQGEGRLPGQFSHPSGVAVDATSNIYVADTLNRRVQVFTSSGAFSFQFPMPTLPPGSGADEGGGKDGKGPGKELRKGLDKGDEAGIDGFGKPFGIGLDAAGNIYVADPAGGRALKFDPGGRLLLAIPIASEQPGRFGMPFGVAVSPSGDCLLVSDRKFSRILKYDLNGGRNLAFGGRGRVKGDAQLRPSASILLRKPMGMAMDAAGNLYVADRNNERIVKYGLPTDQPMLVVPTPRAEDDHVARVVIDKEEGGSVSRKDKAGVIIPAEALPDDLKITVSSAPIQDTAGEDSRRQAIARSNLVAASPPVKYGPEGTQFQTEVTLVLPLSPSFASAKDASEQSISVYYWNDEKGRWEELKSEVDKKDLTVKAKTTHFSLYQVLVSSKGMETTTRAAADPEAAFTFRELYVFPNPARAGAKPTIHLAVGKADQVIIRIYNVAGQQVHEASLDGNPQVINMQYAYEYAWDGHIPSGVYFYVVEAKKGGQGSIRRTGKMAVVR